MDTVGGGPKGHRDDGGPPEGDDSKFREFTDDEVRDCWTYHAVAAVIRGHSLLRSLPDVDPNRIGITGISWGGYLTCIVAGLDHRLKVAVPVYGCGFLGDNSYWTSNAIAKLTVASRERWLRNFDPSQYLSDVDCPILFLNGSNDFAYPLDSYQKSYRLVRAVRRSVSVVLNLPHGHIWTFPEVDAFVDRTLNGGPAFPRISPMQLEAGRVRASYHSDSEIRTAGLNYTLDAGPWQKRIWKSQPATISKGTLEATLPKERPLVFFLSATNANGLRVSAEHQTLVDGR
jgi:dienelactone hydrolase